MTPKRNVAVIDIGKTNAKLALIDMHNLAELAVLKQPNMIIYGPPYPHFDVEALWQFIVNGLREFQHQYGIDAISVTAHGASCALLDEEGNLAAPILDYEHDGPDEVAEEYNALRPEFSETGSPCLPIGLNLGAQIYWQFKTFPDIKNCTRWIVTYPQYWVARLTGVIANEVTSLGCHTDLWNPHQADYSTMVQDQNWKHLMAPLRQANEAIGPVLLEFASNIGLAPTTPVYCGIHDSNASLYPHLLNCEPPFSVVSTGTWVICMAIGGQKMTLDPTRDCLTNVNALGRAVPSSRFMGGREFETIMHGHDQTYEPGDLDHVLDNEIMLLPSVETSSGPFQGMTHSWTVDETTLSSGERFVATSFYLALMTAECLGLIGSPGPILIEGPFADNDLFCDMLHASTGQRVEPVSGTGTSIGAALLCCVPQMATPTALTRNTSHCPKLKAYANLWMRSCDAK